jgi:hypothetical protein
MYKKLLDMKIWNFGMTVIAGIGLIIGIWATAIMSNRAYTDFKYLFVRPPMNYFDVFDQPIIWMLCLLGLVLASIGGLIGKPRYFWPLFVAVGAAYLISTCIVMLAEERWGGVIRITLVTLWTASPGIVFVIEGLIIRHLRKRDDLVISL